MYSENTRKGKNVMKAQFKNEPLKCNFELFSKLKNPLSFAFFGENEWRNGEMKCIPSAFMSLNGEDGSG